MKKKSFENYLTELAKTKHCMDVAEMEKFIVTSTSYSRDLLDRQIEKVQRLIDNRYERYGKITEEDEAEALKQGYYTLCKIGVTLDDVRDMVQKIGFEENSPRGIRIRQDWNYVGHLLNDYLELENANLLTYLQLLKDSQHRIKNQKMYSIYSDKQLYAVYDYLCKEDVICQSDSERADFLKIFRACGTDVTNKIKLNTCKHGAKAHLRVIVEVLTGGFSPSLVNLYFCDYNGKELDLASHNRPTAYENNESKLKKILA